MIEINKYIDFLTKLLAIKKPTVYFRENGKYYSNIGTPKEFELNKNSMATTVPWDNEIYVDLDKIPNGLIYPILAHEIRHCYQWQAVKNPLMNEPKANEWDNAIKHYNNSLFKGYENQSIEIDATAFSKLIVNVVLNKDIQPYTDYDLLMQRYMELSNKYPTDKIIECYERYAK